MARRWIRLEAAWQESEWLAVLPGHVALCWPALLCYVKTRGIHGCCKQPSLRVLSQLWRVDLANVERLIDAAVAHGAIEVDGENWKIAKWPKYNPQDATAAGRAKRYRASRSRLSPLRRDTVTQPVTSQLESLQSDNPLRRDTVTALSRATATATATATDASSGTSVPDEIETSWAAAASVAAGGPSSLRSPNDQRQAVRAMQVAVQATLEACPSERHRSFLATAAAVVHGDDVTAWTNAEGGQVPWVDRPRLLRLALARCAAEQAWGASDLHSKLRYVIPQQLDPRPPPKAFAGPRPGSDAAAITVEQPQGNSRRTGELRRLNREQEEREHAQDAEAARRVDEWALEHEAEAAALWADAQQSETVLQMPKKSREGLARALYRRRVLELITQQPPRLEVQR